MAASRGLRVVVLVALAGLAVALVREWGRPAAPLERPVATRPPVREDETSRVEEGFTWVRTREGRVLFRLEADSLVGVEGGAHFVRGVRRLSLYTEDGREVRLGARAARVLQKRGKRGRDAWELALEGDVVVHDPGGTVLRADRLEWDAELGSLASRGPATVRGTDLVARVARLEYRPGARLVVAHGPVDLDLGTTSPVHVEAERLVYRLATGTVVLETPFRARRPRGSMLAGGGTLQREEAGGWSLEARGPVLLAPNVARVPWAFAADGLRARGGGEVPPAVRAGGPGMVSVPGSVPGTGGTLAAHAWVFERPEEPGGARTLTASGNLRGEWRDRDGSRWELVGEELVAREDAGGRREVEVHGKVRLAGPGGLRGKADKVAWNAGRPDELRLTGSPRARVARGADVIEAPRFLLDRRRRVLEALDAPITDVHATESEDEAGLFEGGRPVRIRSRRVTVPLHGGPLVFEGPLMAWQQDRDLRASRMTWDPDERRLEASGDVLVHVVRRARDEGDHPAAGWLRGRHLVYAATTRTVEVTGETEFRQPGGVTIGARHLRVLLDGEGEVDELVARDDVVLTDRDARGTADLLVWLGGGKGTIVLRAGTRLPELEVKSGGTTRRISAPVIRYDLADGSVHVSGEGGRTRVRTPGGGAGEAREEDQVDRQ